MRAALSALRNIDWRNAIALIRPSQTTPRAARAALSAYERFWFQWRRLMLFATRGNSWSMDAPDGLVQSISTDELRFEWLEELQKQTFRECDGLMEFTELIASRLPSSIFSSQPPALKEAKRSKSHHPTVGRGF
jgi:hypothetical protein